MIGWRLATSFSIQNKSEHASGVGTVISLIFLPSVRSVGASASLFGLIGAQWANITLNRARARASVGPRGGLGEVG